MKENSYTTQALAPPSGFATATNILQITNPKARNYQFITLQREEPWSFEDLRAPVLTLSLTVGVSLMVLFRDFLYYHGLAIPVIAFGLAAMRKASTAAEKSPTIRWPRALANLFDLTGSLLDLPAHREKTLRALSEIQKYSGQRAPQTAKDWASTLGVSRWTVPQLMREAFVLPAAGRGRPGRQTEGTHQADRWVQEQPLPRLLTTQAQLGKRFQAHQTTVRTILHDHNKQSIGGIKPSEFVEILHDVSDMQARSEIIHDLAKVLVHHPKLYRQSIKKLTETKTTVNRKVLADFFAYFLIAWTILPKKRQRKFFKNPRRSSDSNELGTGGITLTPDVISSLMAMKEQEELPPAINELLSHATQATEGPQLAAEPAVQIDSLVRTMGSTVSSLALHPNNRLLVIGLNSNLTDTGGVCFLDRQSGAILQKIKKPVWFSTWNSRGDQLALGRESIHLLTWDDIRGFQGLQIAKRTSTGAMAAAVWNPVNARQLAFLDSDEHVVILDTSEPRTTQTLGELVLNIKRIYSMAWSPNGKILALGNAYGILQLWDIQNPAESRCVFTKDTSQSGVTSLAWKPDGKIIAFGHIDGELEFWNTEDVSNPQFIRSAKAHTGAVTSLAWEPNGFYLASGGADGMARVWDPRDLSLSLDLRGHTKPIIALTWAEATLLSGSEDQTVREWALRSDRPHAAQPGHHLMIGWLKKMTERVATAIYWIANVSVAMPITNGPGVAWPIISQPSKEDISQAAKAWTERNKEKVEERVFRVFLPLLSLGLTMLGIYLGYIHPATGLAWLPVTAILMPAFLFAISHEEDRWSGFWNRFIAHMYLEYLWVVGRGAYADKLHRINNRIIDVKGEIELLEPEEKQFIVSLADFESKLIARHHWGEKTPKNMAFINEEVPFLAAKLRKVLISRVEGLKRLIRILRDNAQNEEIVRQQLKRLLKQSNKLLKTLEKIFLNLDRHSSRSTIYPIHLITALIDWHKNFLGHRLSTFKYRIEHRSSMRTSKKGSSTHQMAADLLRDIEAGTKRVLESLLLLHRPEAKNGIPVTYKSDWRGNIVAVDLERLRNVILPLDRSARRRAA